MVDHSALKEKCLITENIILRFFSGQNIIRMFIRMVAFAALLFPTVKNMAKISQKIWMLLVSQPFFNFLCSKFAYFLY